MRGETMEQEKLIKTLMKNTYVNFLLGAGASFKEVAGKKHFPLMKDLLEYVRQAKEVKKFYRTLDDYEVTPMNMGLMVKTLYDTYLFADGSNIEKFLSIIEGIDLYINDESFLTRIQKQRNVIKTLIRDRLNAADSETVLDNYVAFYKGLQKLLEINGLKNQTLNIFTTNYDMMNETAMEALNIHYYSGFEGVVKRKINISYYNYDFVDTFFVNRAKVSVTPNHMNLFKLHGSLSWYMNKDNELVERNPFENKFIPEIVYPSVDKFDNTNLIISYSALMREFSNRLCKNNTTLFVTGTSMGDEHINKIIENALTIETFHLVVFCATDDLILQLKEKYKVYKNVIIVDEVYNFEQIGEFMQSLQGGDECD